MKKLLILACMLWSVGANAQFTPGQVLTAAELNSQFALYAPLAGATFTGPVSIPNLTVTTTASLPAGSVSLSSLGAQAANTVVANATASSASPTAFPVPSCSTSASALNWTSGTGFTCNTAVNASTLGGATFASPGAIGSGTASTGSFTSLVASGTVSGTGFVNLLSPYALLASPTFTGTPTAPTAAAGTNTTQIATTANVVANFATPPTTGYGSTTPEPVAATTLSSTGNFTPSQTNGIVGTTTNNNANAGSVGEFVTATAAAGSVSLTSGTGTNVTSISLTAGDWDVSGVVQVNPAGTTTSNALLTGISTTSGSLGGLGNLSQLQVSFVTGGTLDLATPVVRLSLASTTPVFLTVQFNFSVSTATAGGVIRARRVR